MENVRCKRCGEEYSSSYHKCPFCQEIAAERRGRPIYRSGKRLTKQQRSAGAGGVMKIVIAAAVLCVMLIVVLWGFFGIRKPKTDTDGEGVQQNTPVDEQQPGDNTGGDQPGDPSDPGNIPDAPIVDDPIDEPIDDPIDPTPGTLTISQSEMIIPAGETARLTVEGADGVIVWTSSNEAVATVSGGSVTGVAGGTVIITATCGSQSVTCTVTITGDPWVNPVELTLNREDFTLSEQYPSFRLKVEGTDSPVIWTSSDPNVATVDESGMVRRVGKGTCKVTAEVDGQKLSCIVRVEGDSQGTTAGLKLNRVDFTLNEEYPSFRLKVEGTDSSVVWTSSDPSVATVDESGMVRRVGKGTCKVTAEVDGQTLSCIVRVK